MVACTSGRGRTAATLACGLLAAAGAAAQSKVTAVRFWSLGDVTRVAIEVSAEFQYKTDRLAGPDRLFFDVLGAKPQMVGHGMHVIAVGDAMLKQIRVAETQPGVTRVVLDLEEGVEYTASQLSNPERLMVELRSQGAKKLFEPPPRAPAPDMTARAPVTKVEVLPPPPALAMAKPAPPAVSAAPAPAPEPARRNSNGDRSMTRALGLKLGRVVLDAGHGGHDLGTHGPSGLTEKELVLDVAKRLGALIEERLGSEVVYTREDDTFIALEERTRMANDRKADLFLSIHANSSPYRSISGVETYYLNFTTSKAALDVAARENATSQRSIFELTELLQKIALKDKVDESREFAARVQSALYGLSAKNNGAARNRGVKKAPFVVLIGASMPSVLAEIGFLSNAADEALMRKLEHRQKIAEALCKGVSAYAGTLSHFQVAKRD